MGSKHIEDKPTLWSALPPGLEWTVQRTFRWEVTLFNGSYGWPSFHWRQSNGPAFNTGEVLSVLLIPVSVNQSWRIGIEQNILALRVGWE